MRAKRYAWRDRRARKRDFRALWITRITAACRMRGTRYSLFINGLQRAGVLLNRKMLSLIAIEDPKTFDSLVEVAKKNTTAVAAAAEFARSPLRRLPWVSSMSKAPATAGAVRFGRPTTAVRWLSGRRCGGFLWCRS